MSGQELCERFGVSRTAVWKAVGQLKKQGYHIEAVQNKGYLLASEGEVYGKNELESRMDTKWAGRPVSFYDVLPSTNLQAKLDAERGAAEGTLVVADMQTAGRGRKGKDWSSPAGLNLYFTLILKPDYVSERVSMATLLMGMAVAESIRDICGLEAGVKWPNDIVIGGRKVCGILAEMSVEREFIHYVVVGVGINVNEQEFDPEIAGTATSLKKESGETVSRARLLASVRRFTSLIMKKRLIPGFWPGITVCWSTGTGRCASWIPKESSEGFPEGSTTPESCWWSFPTAGLWKCMPGKCR